MGGLYTSLKSAAAKATLALLCAVFAVCGASHVAAADSPSSWATAEVSAAISKNLVPLELQFDYAAPITRNDFCKTAVAFIEAAAGKTVEEILAKKNAEINRAAFADTTDENILRVNALGIVNGVEDGRFEPNRSITRQEAATMLTRIVTALELDRVDRDAGDYSWFYDEDQIAGWAKENVNFISNCVVPDTRQAVMGGVGSGRFSPRTTFTREQSFITMLRLLESTRYMDGRSLMPLESLPNAPDADSGNIPNWSSPEDLYLFETDAGFAAFSYDPSTGLVTVHESDASFRPVRSIALAKELSLFGGVHRARDGSFYVLTGESNVEENPNKEVIRVVKYDANLNRISAASIAAGPSVIRIPFDAGNPEMDDFGSELTVHTSRERFTSEDGKNHQSNLTIRINTDRMTVTAQSEPFPGNHVSHSFRQFVKYDRGTTVYVDHGDAYPRAICLQTDSSSSGAISAGREISLLRARGAIGENYTGMAPGGFEITAENYMVAVATINQQSAARQDVHNIVLLSVPRGAASESNVKTRALTDFSESGSVTASVPYLVRISDDRFAVIWSEFDLSADRNRRFVRTRCIVADGAGNPVGDAMDTLLPTSQGIQPIYSKGRIYWMYRDRAFGPAKQEALYATYLCTLDMMPR
jgi:hypothetical protein